MIVKLDERWAIRPEIPRAGGRPSDGTALYATEDLALAIQKFQDYPRLCHAPCTWWMCARPLHFTQVFKTLELPVPVGVAVPAHSLRTGQPPGNVVMVHPVKARWCCWSILIREAFRRALEVVEQKNLELSAEQNKDCPRGRFGAIKYPMLARENTKIVTFDWEAALDFNGQAAPYIQYAFVRANSILRKAGGRGSRTMWSTT